MHSYQNSKSVTTNTFNIGETLSEIETFKTEYKNLIAHLNDDQFNTRPFSGSWTPGQLTQHLIKSASSLARALSKPGQEAERDPLEERAGLEKLFLDFSSKMKSPEFITPDDKNFTKADLMIQLDEAYQKVETNAFKTNLTEFVSGLPLGELTKVEAVYFVSYHTQRHLHQLKKMIQSLLPSTDQRS